MARNGRKKVKIEFCPVCGKWRFCRIEGGAVINVILECPICSANFGVPRDINREIGLVMMKPPDSEPEIYMGVKGLEMGILLKEFTELEMGVLFKEFMVRAVPLDNFYGDVFRNELAVFEKLAKGEKIDGTNNLAV